MSAQTTPPVKTHLWNSHPLTVWLRDTWRMRRFVAHPPSEACLLDTTPRRQAVVITPWFGSPVPWFSLAVGLLLVAKGHVVTFVIDDMPFGSTSLMWRLQLMAIRQVLAVVARRHIVVCLRDYLIAGELDANTRAAIDRLAYLNAVWARKGETGIDKGAMGNTSIQLAQAQLAIDRLLQAHPLDLLFVPGGICATSGLWMRAGRQRGIRVSTYDSGGYGVLLLAANGIACQLHDIPRAYAMLNQHIGAGEERALVIQFAEEELGKRRAGTDKFSSQVTAVSGKLPEYEGGVLIALNSPWDSAALGLHAVFDTTQEWIVQTVRYLLTHTEVPVLVRQHPVERLPIARSVDDTRELLRQHFGEHPRLYFIAAEDPVNSYDLMEQVNAVVVYTSTVGVEAAAHGKVVITESTSYYADLGFVFKASTAEAYYSLLSDAFAGRREVTSKMREAALTCYYITQCCNWMQTSFTVPDFPNWSRRSLLELSQDRSVQTVLRAIETDTPISFLIHMERWTALGRSVPCHE